MSKKTEVKDIKWANEEIKKEWNLLNDKRYEREVDDLTTGVLLGLKKALNILDKLDEPEVVPNEVEEEQKYVLLINITDKASKTNYETYLNKKGIFHSMENESFNKEDFNWSEEEIKDLENGEILFEHFAVKVEEME